MGRGGWLGPEQPQGLEDRVGEEGGGVLNCSLRPALTAQPLREEGGASSGRTVCQHLGTFFSTS